MINYVFCSRADSWVWLVDSHHSNLCSVWHHSILACILSFSRFINTFHVRWQCILVLKSVYFIFMMCKYYLATIGILSFSRMDTFHWPCDSILATVYDGKWIQRDSQPLCCIKRKIALEQKPHQPAQSTEQQEESSSISVPPKTSIIALSKFNHQNHIYGANSYYWIPFYFNLRVRANTYAWYFQ